MKILPRNNIQFPIAVLLLSLIIFACEKPDQPQPVPSGNYTNGVWIINEGGYTYANASVDFYHKDKDTLEKNVFENVNGYPLGDVLQSIMHYDGKYYLVVNSSYKIEVVDDKNFKRITTIDNLKLPRYLLPVNNQKAYLTNETAKEITVIDLSSSKVINHIPYNPGPDTLWSWTEQMVQSGNNVYAAAVKTGKLLVINSLTDKITDTISLSAGAENVIIDKDNKIWVLCDGTVADPYVNSALYCIDPATNKIVRQLIFPDKNTAARLLTANASRDTLYYNYHGICKIGIHQAGLPGNSFITGNGHDFYGIGIDPDNGSVYAGDDLGFNQTGLVFQYNSNGKILKTHQSGVGPNGFLFVK